MAQMMIASLPRASVGNGRRDKAKRPHPKGGRRKILRRKLNRLLERLEKLSQKEERLGEELPERREVSDICRDIEVKLQSGVEQSSSHRRKKVSV